MKTALRLFAHLLLFAAFALTSPQTFAAKPPHSKKKPAYTPPPTPTPPAAPSVDLTSFLSTNGDKIFSAYTPQTPLPKAELAQLRASFSARFGKAGLADRDQYKYAIAICDGLSLVMTEKTAPQTAAAWTQRSTQLRQWIDQLMVQEKAAESGPAAPAR